MDELQNIQNLIYVIRGQRVMLDSDIRRDDGFGLFIIGNYSGLSGALFLCLSP